ncbi:hypothetical protein J5X84_20035 [Streptosporangiaceae bacterium NEAU-GS5]|nr:hypothetical protein [Streptosporangiaceae bacterium NEAU-GS5]
MSLDALAKPGVQGGRFLLVDYLPTYAGALVILVLVWAGAPGQVDFARAWRTASGLSAGEIVLLGVAITLIAVLGVPLQLALVRVLEGEWPFPALTRRALERQALRRTRLAEREQLPDGPIGEADVQAAGVAGARLRRLYPPPELLRPTALGNALAATEAGAGEPYGLDAVVVWPRLYPLLSPGVKTVVDDRRDMLDAAARLSATMAIVAVAAFGLLVASGWWLPLAAVPAAIAWAAYVGAVHAAVAYGEAVRAAIDLERFALIDALRLPRPLDPDDERRRNAALCDQWRQGVRPAPEPYRHPS